MFSYVGKLAFQGHIFRIFTNLPNSEIFSGSCNQVWMCSSLYFESKFCDAYLIRNPHNLCGWIFMLEVRAMFKIAFFLIYSNNFDLIRDVLAVWAESEAEIFLLSIAEIYSIEWPLCLMSVNLFPLTRLLLQIRGRIIIIFTFSGYIIHYIITCSSWLAPLTVKSL